MQRLLREPLLHFLLLGACLFGLYALVRGGSLQPAKEIVVSRGQVQSLQAQFVRARLREPSPDEVRHLVESWVREEIQFREGLAMGLDRDDPVVRRRIAQKLEFIVDDARAAPPTLPELQAWLDANATKYQVEPGFSFTQFFFDPARRGGKLDADVAAARLALAKGSMAAGDATMLPHALDNASASHVKRVFGKEFAEAMGRMPIATWAGPIRSTYGIHLVKLDGVRPARQATLDEARAEVERDFTAHRAAHASAASYMKLRARYVVRDEAAAAVAP